MLPIPIASHSIFTACVAFLPFLSLPLTSQSPPYHQIFPVAFSRWYFCAVWRVAGVLFSHLLGDFADSGDPLIQTRAVVPGIGHARSFGVARSVCDAAVLVLHV